MTLTDRDRKIMLALVPVLVLVAYWFLVLAPKREEASTAAEELSTQQAAGRQRARAGADGEGRQAELRRQLRAGRAPGQGDPVDRRHAEPARAARRRGGRHRHQASRRSRPASGSRAPPRRRDAHDAARGGLESGTTGTPVAAGGQTAQSQPGGAAEAANNAQQTANQRSSCGRELGRQPIRHPDLDLQRRRPAGRRRHRREHRPTGQTSGAAGLETVPLELEFEGDFFNLADFFHHVKRFVSLTNDNVVVSGRLVTVESDPLGQRLGDLPPHPGGDHGDDLPVAEGAGRDGRRDPAGSVRPRTPAGGGTAPAESTPLPPRPRRRPHERHAELVPPALERPARAPAAAGGRAARGRPDRGADRPLQGREEPPAPAPETARRRPRPKQQGPRGAGHRSSSRTSSARATARRSVRVRREQPVRAAEEGGRQGARRDQGTTGESVASTDDHRHHRRHRQHRRRHREHRRRHARHRDRRRRPEHRRRRPDQDHRVHLRPRRDVLGQRQASARSRGWRSSTCCRAR